MSNHHVLKSTEETFPLQPYQKPQMLHQKYYKCCQEALMPRPKRFIFSMERLMCTVLLHLCFSGIVYAHTDLLSCLHTNGVTNLTTPSRDPSSPSQYDTLFRFSLQNLRFTEPSVRRPSLIIIPQSRKQVQKAVACSVKHGWEIRVRSGGHSYEGLSSTSDIPFVLIDLMDVDKVEVDTKSFTAWVDAGATLGQVYSAIAAKTGTHGFPAGTCPTVGSSGHFSGGGQGVLTRKYGLAADNILDVILVTASGQVLERETMGEDLFWALRGGGGGSWGVVIAWKIRLVSLPALSTVFTVLKTGRDQVTDTLHRWQYVAPYMEDDLFMRVQVFGIEAEKRNIRASFHGIYLGPKEQLLQKVNASFPELGMTAEDCSEMSWIQSAAYFAGTNVTVTELSNRYNSDKNYFKNKSDFARKPIRKSALRGLWPKLEKELGANIIFSPLGGIMSRIPSNALPYPHRAGTLMDIQYALPWYEEGHDARYIEWMRNLYKYMTPYVSKSPRAAYVNYLDLDLGYSVNGTSSVEEARAWGEKYFLHNFDRLVKVKSRVDPHNVFRNAQSIPVMK